MKRPTFHRLNPEVGIKVLEQYKYTCQACGSQKGLCIHHVERKDINAPDYNDINNLTVLCRSCHMKLHRLAGHIPTTGKNSKGFFGGRRGYDPPIKCKDCDRLQHARGYCNRHYEYRRKHKTLM